ncbi:MAG TPA: chloride channel protein [Rhodopila sp.]|nr:chloride channel protein [Rhodopila sp.]
MRVARGMISPILAHRRAIRFWCAVVLTGVTTGLATAALTWLLERAQEFAWHSPRNILDAAEHTAAFMHPAILFGAAIIAGVGRIVLTTGGTTIDINAAIWFNSGRLPKLRTLGNAILSIIIVGMGTALGREGAPKQAGAVFADACSDRAGLDDEERRLLVACGAGAGMSAAYGVPVGGALFALEVLRGALALRFVLPALTTSLIATGISWLFMPDMPIYAIPDYPSTASASVWAILAAPILGFAAMAFVRLIAWADRHKPKNAWWKAAAPVLVLTTLGALSIPFPQLLGNGRDVAHIAFTGRLDLTLLAMLALLRPASSILCLACGTPGGLFTPSLATGALLGGLLGVPWLLLWPGTPAGVFALVGATAFVAATTQGPLSTIVLMMEMSGWSRGAILPILTAVSIATLVSRTAEPRSIYDARLSDAQIQARERARDRVANMAPTG